MNNNTPIKTTQKEPSVSKTRRDLFLARLALALGSPLTTRELPLMNATISVVIQARALDLINCKALASRIDKILNLPISQEFYDSEIALSKADFPEHVSCLLNEINPDDLMEVIRKTSNMAEFLEAMMDIAFITLIANREKISAERN